MAKITKVVERFTGNNNRLYTYACLNLQVPVADNVYTKDEIDDKISRININNISEAQLVELKQKLEEISFDNFLSDNEGNLLEDIDGNPIHE